MINKGAELMERGI